MQKSFHDDEEKTSPGHERHAEAAGLPIELESWFKALRGVEIRLSERMGDVERNVAKLMSKEIHADRRHTTGRAMVVSAGMTAFLEIAREAMPIIRALLHINS